MDDSRGRLSKCKDSLSREITYIYDSANHLRSVIDFANRIVIFNYDNNDNLIEIISPAVTGTVNGNDFPTGKTWSFTYSAEEENEELNHNILTITAPNVPDYFEGDLTAGGCSCGFTLEELINKFGIDISSVADQLNQGDLNEDGKFQMCGNTVLIRSPRVNLRSNSPQAAIEGSAAQTIERRISYNQYQIYMKYLAS